MDRMDKKLLALSPMTQLENYVIKQTLSVGGFGVVYLAEETDTGDLVAIKEYFPNSIAMREEGCDNVMPQFDLDEDLFNAGLKCFFEEARLLSTVKHPNVVNVRTFFPKNKTVYMVMDYYDGHGLDKELSRATGMMTERRIRTLFGHIVSGLREVHLKKMLHLDIKPANIYLPRFAPPIILDFGAARQSVQIDGRQLVGMYTPGFAAPEQLNNTQKQGPWSDVYAVGATMYAVMARATPLSSEKRLIEDTLPPATVRFEGSYSDELLALVDDCMRLDIDERIGSMNSILKVLMARPVKWGDAKEGKSGSKENMGFFKKLFGKKRGE